MPSIIAVKLSILSVLAGLIIYYDVKYRRIPNLAVIFGLISGLIINSIYSGFAGIVSSIEGCLIAFLPMLGLHLFGAMGAGDVKLFGAIGAVVGAKLILPTMFVVIMIGGMLGVYTMLRSGRVFSTLHGVLRIFVGLLPGWEMPRFSLPPDRKHTIPYGVAITTGSLISVLVFRP
jgi:prepilin peptidase CpaA